jgi:hypothetical protein
MSFGGVKVTRKGYVIAVMDALHQMTFHTMKKNIPLLSYTDVGPERKERPLSPKVGFRLARSYYRILF